MEKIRTLMFGVSAFDNRIVPVTAMPATVLQCGLYVHVDDIEKYKKLEADVNAATEPVNDQTKSD